MSRYGWSVFVVFAVTALVYPAAAQTTALKPKAPLNAAGSKEKSEATAEADRLAKERRAQARSLLTSLASDARSFRDHKLRARSLAKIADSLWSVDAEEGRALFRKAWEAADTADRESTERLRLREGVLQLVARRDYKLSEEFLQKLKLDQQESKTELPESNLWELAEASEKRLNLAKNLLSTGDVELALQFADPVLSVVTISTVDFLTLLRQKDPAAADQRYAAMLAATSGNMSTDANTVSLWSSYIFTPRLYITFSRSGAPSTASRNSASFQPANVGAQLRLAFFQAAGAVLLRPQPPPDQDKSSAGMAGKYLIVRRLMPLFEQYAPRETSDLMRSQLETLNSLVSQELRQDENEWVKKGISPEKQRLADQEQSLLDQIEHAKSSDERDELKFQLALFFLSGNDMRARDIVSKIDESAFRKRAQAWIDWGLAAKAIENKKTDTALELAPSAELSHIQRIWILTQVAKLLPQTDRDKSRTLIEEAMAEVGRIEGAGLDRPRALLAIANALRLVDPLRAWDATYDAVKAENSTDGFTGEDGVISVTANSKNFLLRRTEPVPDFDIDGIFSKLANSDFERAIQLARGFQGEAPRAIATIAISRSVLNEKSAVLPTTKN